MELWIRSQDRKELLNVNNLAVIENRIVFINNGNGRTTLGTYKSIERAVEVLDEIQDLMRSLTDSDLKIIQYEMPKE